MNLKKTKISGFKKEMMMAWQAQQQRHLRFWLPSPSCRCCLLSQEGRREGGPSVYRPPPFPLSQTNGERRRSTPPLLATLLSFSCRIVSYPLARSFFVSTNDFCLSSDGEYQGGEGKIRRKKITYHRDLGNHFIIYRAK